MKAKPIALGGCLAAVSVLFLYLASVLPTGRLALLAAASLCVGLAVIYMQASRAVVMYAAVSALALLLLPDKTVAVWYIVCLGNYPIVKCWIERLGKLPLEWICKLLCYAVYAAMLYGAYHLLMGGIPAMPYALWLIVLLGAAVFAGYDLVFSLCMTEALRRFPNGLFTGK